MPSSRLFNFVLTLALCAAFGASTASRAADAARSGGVRVENGYSLTFWQTEDGLPQNTVTAITQSQDGYLWIATYGGLARFDGERFKTFDAGSTPELEDSRIVSLYAHGDDLWIGHDSGRLTRYRAGRFQPVATNAPKAERVAGVVSDRRGEVWLLRGSGALESLGGARFDAPRINGSTTAPGSLMLVDNAQGAPWVLEDGALWRIVDGQRERIDFGYARFTNYTIGIGAARDGGIWVARDHRLKKWKDGQWTEDRGFGPWGENSIAAMLELRDGTVAVGTIQQGLYLVFRDGSSRHFDRASGLPQNWIRCLYEDREGNLWVGVGTAGLAAVRPTAFSVVNAPDDWQGRSVLSVAASHDGALWIGSEGAGLYRLSDGEWTRFSEPSGLSNTYIWSVAEVEGRIWAGTWAGGPYQLDGDKLALLPELQSLTSPIFAIEPMPERGEVWIGAGIGLLRIKNGQVSHEYDVQPGSSINVATVTRDHSGVVWFGVNDGGLGRISDGKLTIYKKAQGLSSDSIHCLLADDDGTLWIGTADGGLNRYRDGKFTSFGMKEGLPSNAICHIADDGFGYLWLSTHHGIARIAKADLNAQAEHASGPLPLTSYDRSDGLPTIEFAGGLHAGGCKSPDGRLWFASAKGVVTIDPRRIQNNATPPPVVLEEIRVDSRAIELAPIAPTRLELPPGHQRLEFQYTALSFTAPKKVAFKYRLEGLDGDWVQAGEKRSASYSHLPAGRYRFRVIACNNDGVWNNEGAMFAFTVLPYFWQTWWFVALASIVALSAAALIARHQTRRRLQRRLEQLERERAIERERARIAQDIHDDIGASLTQIAMLTESAPSEAKDAIASAAVLDQIGHTAREATRSLDEIVWAVDPRHDTLDSVIGYMGKFAQDFLEAAGVRCRLDMPMSLPAWPLTAETRHNLFLAFKEALNNAVKHAAPTEVRVSVSLLQRGFMIRVQDNGRGFDHTAQPKTTERVASGHGLENLRQRLAAIGGRCEIASVPNQGSSISFIIDGVETPDSPLTKIAPSAAPREI